MTPAQTKRFGWLVSLAAAAAVGGILWYSHTHGWLAPAYHWVHHLTSKGDEGTSGRGGMSMNMPEMDMGSMPAKESEASSVPGHAVVTVPGEVQQRIGVRVGQVERAPLRMSVRTVGIVRPDETKVARVHLKTEGWAEKLFVNFTGQKVKKGDPLLAIYSPQFLTSQQEYLNARQSKQESLAELARQRLELWDVPPESIDQLEKSGKPTRTLTLQSPLTGTVLEKNVLEREYVTRHRRSYTSWLTFRPCGCRPRSMSTSCPMSS